MTRISGLVCAAGAAGFFFDDQRAIKAGAVADGFFYRGQPQTAGFRSIRQAGESISVLLQLGDGQTAFGDCASIQYSGAGGRDELFLARDFIPVIEQHLKPLLVGRELSAFRPLAGEVEALRPDGRGLHSAIRYGVSQAILDAVARAQHRLPCEVLASEYGLPLEPSPVRVFAQTGDERHVNADKMILKAVDVLPHGLINSIPDKLGADGGRLLEYVTWLRDRILQWRTSPDYSPELHIDVYGTTGIVFANGTDRIGEYLATLGRAAMPFALRIEGPVDMGERAAQYAKLLEIRTYLRDRGIPVGIVADEWCNSLDDIRTIADMGAVDMVQIKTPVLGGIQNSMEAVLYCRSRGVQAYLGGTCNETERSAQLCVHVALASRPYQMLAKPGMGTDEGLMVVRNEMSRTLALLRSGAAAGGSP